MSITELAKTLIPPRYHPAARKLHRKLDWWLRGQKLYRWLRVLPYIGNEAYCPCCDSHFRRFISYSRGNGMCPRCDSLDRHRYFTGASDNVTFSRCVKC